MEQKLVEFFGVFGFVVFVFLIILAVLWFLLPFVIFGISNKLNELIRLNKSIEGNTDIITNQLKSLNNNLHNLTDKEIDNSKPD
jgi:predicted PurR-regulated permease PerM